MRTATRATLATDWRDWSTEDLCANCGECLTSNLNGIRGQLGHAHTEETGCYTPHERPHERCPECNPAATAADVARVHGWGYHVNDPRPGCAPCIAEAAEAATRAAGRWAVSLPTAERGQLRRGYESLFVEHDRGGFSETDRAAANVWLAAEWVAAGSPLVTA